MMTLFQGSQDSNISQPSSDLSYDEEGEALRQETAKQALAQLEKARVGDNTVVLTLLTVPAQLKKARISGPWNNARFINSIFMLSRINAKITFTLNISNMP